MGIAELLDGVVSSPETWRKHCGAKCMKFASRREGFMNISTSSAYKDAPDDRFPTRQLGEHSFIGGKVKNAV
jgi:hypothetical protein